jgi:MFS family permease
MGIGLGLTFVPTLSITVHYFNKRRGLASGVALSGSALGATVFPISMLFYTRLSAHAHDFFSVKVRSFPLSCLSAVSTP